VGYKNILQQEEHKTITGEEKEINNGGELKEK
jgi:hypothetical protein